MLNMLMAIKPEVSKAEIIMLNIIEILQAKCTIAIIKKATKFLFIYKWN